MTKLNKINGKQKEIMAEFMSNHPNLAKNILPNCSQGRATANRLWEDLSKRLNTYGPPTKNPVLWRKVYADQKHNVKKKLSFNKQSKCKTGGGAYEEMVLDLLSKLDRLIELKEESLKRKEEEHTVNMKLKNVELEIKIYELEILKQKQEECDSASYFLDE